MSVKRLSQVVVLAVLTTSLSVNVLAQDNQIAGIIGRTFISDQGIKSVIVNGPTIHFGNGLTFEANYSRRVLGQGFTRIWLEVPAVFNLDEDLNAPANVIPESFKSIFVTPSVRANFFAMTAISPWVSFGGGFGHFSTSDKLVFGGPNPGSTGTTTGVMQAGVGLDVRIHGLFSLRGEARDFWSGTPNLLVDTGHTRQHNYFVGGGVVYHFGK